MFIKKIDFARTFLSWSIYSLYVYCYIKEYKEPFIEQVKPQPAQNIKT